MPLRGTGSGSLQEVSDLLALNQVPGHSRHHLHIQSRGPGFPLPHSSSLQEWRLEDLMNSLFIPLSGESNGGGRLGGELFLLRLHCWDLISLLPSLRPWQKLSQPFLLALPPASFQTHASPASNLMLPLECANIHLAGWIRITSPWH